jgi:hypothetical protein
MGIVADTIELKTHLELTVLRMTNVEKFADGSGYRCRLSIRSGRFSYDGPFLFDDHFLFQSIEAMKQCPEAP